MMKFHYSKMGVGQAYFRDAPHRPFLVSMNRDVLKKCSVNRD